MHAESKEHDSSSKETWKQLSKQPQNACQQNAIEHISLFSSPLSPSNYHPKFKRDKDFHDNFDSAFARMENIYYVSHPNVYNFEAQIHLNKSRRTHQT